MSSLYGHELAQAFHATREQSENACKTLELEDYGLQAAAFCSPPKWHLAHTSWFFETFLLKPFAVGYEVLNPAYEALFNSYYNTIHYSFFLRDYLTNKFITNKFTTLTCEGKLCEIPYG